MPTKRLSDFSIGEVGHVESVNAPRDEADALLELGIGPGEEIALRGKSPFGDPLIIELMNYRLALRVSDAARISLHVL